MFVVKLNHLNLFLYLNKIYNHDCCQVKPSFVYYLHNTHGGIKNGISDICITQEDLLPLWGLEKSEVVLCDIECGGDVWKACIIILILFISWPLLVVAELSVVRTGHGEGRLLFDDYYCACDV